MTSCGEKTPPVNIYDSDEYKNLTRKEIIVGESIWATACFRCHRYGTNGATLLENKAYWDQAATKGLDELYKSVWEGKKGENGVMPPKGFCNLCSEDEIKKSVLYIFHLYKKVQESEKNNNSTEQE
jgi:cytochrome c5|tara:strand:- start:142 stop:519 length:378 start_codon:yes stop_codon:yes gene_type:complete